MIKVEQRTVYRAPIRGAVPRFRIGAAYRDWARAMVKRRMKCDALDAKDCYQPCGVCGGCNTASRLFEKGEEPATKYVRLRDRLARWLQWRDQHRKDTGHG